MLAQFFVINYEENVMPVFEYVCLKCSHSFKAFHQESSSTYTICPLCGENTLQKNAENAKETALQESQDFMMCSSR